VLSWRNRPEHVHVQLRTKDEVLAAHDPPTPPTQTLNPTVGTEVNRIGLTIKLWVIDERIDAGFHG